MRWSDEEVETLRKLYPTTPNRELAERLRRSQYSVEMKAKSLRLRKEPSPPPTKEPPSRHENEFTVITREEATKRDKVELLRYSWSLTDMYRRELENPGLDDARRQKIMKSMANMINVTNSIMRNTPDEVFEEEPDLDQRFRLVVSRDSPIRSRRVRLMRKRAT